MALVARVSTLVAVVVGGLAFSGCGSSMTRRDEFYLIRGMTFQPQAGDGTTIVVGHEQDVLRAIAGAGDRPGRGVEVEP